MKIQNITGVTKLFALGERSHTLAANQIRTLDDTPKAIVRVMAEVELGNLKLIESPIQNTGARSRTTPVTFAVKLGALLRWADGDKLAINGVNFEADTNATVTAGNILVPITGVDLAGLENAFAAKFEAAASAAALAAVGVTYVAKRTLGAVTTFVFTLDPEVVTVAAAVIAFTNAGGSGTAPSVIKPAVLTTITPQTLAVDAVVPVGATKLVFNFPGTQILGTPTITVWDADGLLVAYATAPTLSVSSVELTGLTAGHVVSMVALIR